MAKTCKQHLWSCMEKGGVVTTNPSCRDYRTCSEYIHGGSLVPKEHQCNDLRFEALSPAYWCPLGYVLVYWDHRGCSQSPGYFKTWCSSHFDGASASTLS